MRALPLVALALAACSGSRNPEPTPPHNASALDVTIASVTLADDCGTGPTAIPDDDEAAAADVPDRPMASQSASAKRGASMSQAYQGDRACEQSSIQLRVANGTDAASAIAIAKVELLDDGGRLIGELTPRAPSKWADDSYQAWDQNVAAGQTLQVSYALSRPEVSRGATYTVRVTLAGDAKRTLEKQATLEAEASLPPGAVT